MADELWKVTNVVDTQMFIPGQGAVSAKKVTFSTITGTVSSINIPDTEFNPETVGSAIHDAATKIIEVQALTGPSLGTQITDLGYNPADYPNG